MDIIMGQSHHENSMSILAMTGYICNINININNNKLLLLGAQRSNRTSFNPLCTNLIRSNLI